MNEGKIFEEKKEISNEESKKVVRGENKAKGENIYGEFCLFGGV